MRQSTWNPSMDLWVPTGSAPLPSYAAQLPSDAAPVPTDSARVPSDRGRVPSDLAPACDSGLVPMHSISNARGGHRTQVFSIAAKMLTTMPPRMWKSKLCSMIFHFGELVSIQAPNGSPLEKWMRAKMVRQAVQKTMGLQNSFATEPLAIVVLLSP